MTVYANNNLRPVAGFQYVPVSMEARGQILPLPSYNPNVRNGAGIAISMGLPGFVWTFQTMDRVEMDWWMALLGLTGGSSLGTLSKSFSGVSGGLPAARLWTSDLTLRIYSHAVIDMPVWESYRNGRFHNVQVRFTALY